MGQVTHVKARKPFVELFTDVKNGKLLAEFIDSVTHYELDNGRTVSLMDRSKNIGMPGMGWEGLYWPTALGAQHNSKGPFYFETEARALRWRDAIAELPLL